MPGVDALRALAVVGVFCYHTGTWMPGGFLGVDLFLVISGFLITSLLLQERRENGFIDVKRFWMRRVRRLLPAVGVFIAITLVAAAIFRPADIAGLRGDAVAAFAYIANWHFIFESKSYFESFEPSLLKHLWSLSVEEQFYLLWPVIFALGMNKAGRTRVLYGLMLTAVLSVILMAVLFKEGGDPTRVYYGTDTHAVGLLVGATLAFVWNPWQLREQRPGRHAANVIDGIGVGALLLVLLCFASIHDFDTSLYRGGFLVFSLISAALIGVMAHPIARLPGVIAKPAVLWLGVRSYSFYLWHWPILALTRPGIDIDVPSIVLIPLQFALALWLANLSYRYVERPFRAKQGEAATMTKAGRVGSEGLFGGRGPVLAGAVIAVVALVGWSGIVSTEKETPPQPAGVKTPAAAERKQKQAEEQGLPSIYALGDSVMVGAAQALGDEFGPNFTIDAHESRQADEFIWLVNNLKTTGQFPDYLIIHMGNNGPLTDDQMAGLEDAAAGVKQLFLINDAAAGVTWVPQSNDEIAKAAATWDNTTMIDWNAVGTSSGTLTFDGLHLTPDGIDAYVGLISDVLEANGVEFGPAAARRICREQRDAGQKQSDFCASVIGSNGQPNEPQTDLNGIPVVTPSV